MNVDAYAILEVNLQGEARCLESKFLDVRLEFADFEDDFIADTLRAQLPRELTDVLVMCLFKYRNESSEDYWSGAIEYEDHFDLISHNVLQSDYKEFYRFQVTEITGTRDMSTIEWTIEEEKEYFAVFIAAWEEFYDEEFKPSTTSRR